MVAFEQGSFDIKLPEIYRRGFVKNYARYLNLDADKIMIEYSAVTGSSNLSRSSRRENRETLGRMDFNPNHSANTKPSIRPSQGAVGSPSGDLEEAAPEAKTKELKIPTIDNSVYWKIGLVVGGGLVLIILLVSLINVITQVSDDDTAVAVAGSEGTAQVADGSPPALASSGGSEVFTLIAIDRVFVVVTESGSQEQVFKRSLDAGEEITLNTNGPAEIAYTDPEKLQIRMNGRLYSLEEGYKTSTDSFNSTFAQ